MLATYVSLYGKNVVLLRDEGQVQAHWRWQQDMHRHVFPVIVGGGLVHWHSICKTCVWYTCIVTEGRGASADGFAAATEHAPARILSGRQRRGGAMARRLQRVPLS